MPEQKIKAVKFEITFHEGNQSKCNACGTYASWQALNSALYKLVWYAQRHDLLGVLKTDAVITWADGFEYTARLGVGKSGADSDAAQHIKDEALFHTGQWRPAHMSEAQYNAYLAEYVTDEHKAAYAAFLAGYSLED